MGPVAWDILLLEGTSKGSSHVVHSLANGNEFVEPLLTVGWIRQNGTSDSCAVFGWGGVVRANKDFDLREYFLGGLLIGAHEVEGTSSLTVKSHSLSEGLSDDHLEALVDEKAETISVLVEGS